MKTQAHDVQLGVLRPAQVREANAATILRLLLAQGPMPRAAIAKKIGLTQGPVTRISTQLADAGLVHELAPMAAAGRGRPRIPLALRPEAFATISVHLGVEHIAIGLIDAVGTAHQQVRLEHDGSIEDALDQTVTYARTLLASHPNILGMGVIIGGWVDATSGTVRQHPFLDWHGLALRDRLAERMEIPVYVDSNARAHALADLVYGGAGTHRNFIHVFIGNILEMAAVVNGTILSAEQGFGGLLSHWPLATSDNAVGPATEVIGDQALVKQAKERGLLPGAGTFDALVSLARGRDTEAVNGDTTATDSTATPASSNAVEAARDLLFQRAYRAGELIAQLNAAIAPELIVVSSGVLYLEGSLDRLRQGVEDSQLTLQCPPIVSGNTTPASVLQAAASVVVSARVLTPMNLRDLLVERMN